MLLCNNIPVTRAKLPLNMSLVSDSLMLHIRIDHKAYCKFQRLKNAGYISLGITNVMLKYSPDMALQVTLTPDTAEGS